MCAVSPSSSSTRRAARLQRRKLPAAPILAADTTVALGRRILGKPADPAEAREMLLALAGRTHRVLTAVAVSAGPHSLIAMNVTRVAFSRFSSLAIDAYVDSGEPQGKAGAYAIQGRAAGWVTQIDGSYSGVMGLPLLRNGGAAAPGRPAHLRRRAGLRRCAGRRSHTMASMQDILINWTPQETRVAVVENGAVQDLYIERTLERGLVGNIYAGRVARVLPGMQSAFIDIGLERAAFLHVADVNLNGGNGARRTRRERRMPAVPIERLVFEGQTLTVQVIKDPIGSKGARVSTQISIAGRLLVFLPHDDHIGISQKIGSQELREQLRARMGELVRTADGSADRRLHPAHQCRRRQR